MTLPPVPAHLTDVEFMRVFTTYVFASPLAHGKSVLDAGCGTGHGSWLLRERGARAVVAVDLDPANARLIRDISRRGDRIVAAVMDVQALALADARFDLTVCFEVIEHLPEPKRLLGELRRTAAPDAVAIVSTPNRRTRLRDGERPWNPDHLREYDLAALRAELSAFYPAVEILGIYGTGGLHERYLDEWRPTVLRSARAIVRRAIPAAVVEALRARRGTVTSAPRDIPPPDARTWPFYVGGVSDRCLNFMAVCGSDPAMVASIARALRVREA